MIRPRVKVEVRNSKVMDRLLKELPALKKAYVTVGFHEDAGEYEDGTSVVEVALWNEFGTKTSPSRPFIRAAVDENIEKINKWREEALVDIIEKEMPVAKALESIGFKVQALIQDKIKSNVPPPNAESVRRQKQREGVPQSTLINTGLMLRSVSYRVFA
jgi:hypothetical protein